MATPDHVRNPLEWGWQTIKRANVAAQSVANSVLGAENGQFLSPPVVRRIGITDLKHVLTEGFADLGAYRTDVIFLCVIYPVVGLILARLTFGYAILPLLFPLAAGFALVGPAAAVGLYEMSRRREQGIDASWGDAFAVVNSPAFGAIAVLALLLVIIFVVWLVAAYAIFLVTLGPAQPASVSVFVRDIFTTPAGWAMIFVGVGVGFLFAALVLTISVISFPLLLDRNVGLYAAVMTSIRAVAINISVMAVWGMIVAGGLVLGSIPLFLGLTIIIPVLGHATWHLYRKLVASSAVPRSKV
jgi:uncharacterized membrane protein